MRPAWKDQVDEYDPPPNPAKLKDTRCRDYISKFGDSCWELDALEPSVITELVDSNIQGLVNHDSWDEAIEEEKEGKEKLLKIARKL